MRLTRIAEYTSAVLIGIAIAGTAYVVAAPADPVPSGRIIPYEGYVEIDGVPLNAEGRKMCFRLYSAPSGGEPFWQSGPMDVVFTHGTFSVNLGSGTRLTEQAFSTASLHLGVELLAAGSATCSADRSGELTNRQQLVNPWLATNGPAFISGTNEGTGSAGVLLGQPPRAIGGVREAGALTWQTGTGAHPFGGAGDKTAIVLRSAIGGGDATELVIENGDDADDTIRLQAPGGVNVSGNQNVSGRLAVSGEGLRLDRAPVAAGSERHAGGIFWPDNLFGGTGDFASIRLQGGSTGEAQSLRISIGGDADDQIILSATGGVRVDGNLRVTGDLQTDNNPRTGECIDLSTSRGDWRLCPSGMYSVGGIYRYSSAAGDYVVQFRCCPL